MKIKNFPLKNIIVEKILPSLKGEGSFEGVKYSFPYTSIGDEVFFEERGRGKRRHLVVIEIRRNNKLEYKCNYFSNCGGCSGQHIPYKEQFFLKTNHLVEMIKNKFSINPIVEEASDLYGYRNRMDFAIFPGNKIGLHQAGNFRRVIDINFCHLQNEKGNNEIKNFRKILNEFPEIIFDRKTEEGYLKYITYRRAIFNDDDILILTFAKGFEGTETEKILGEKILQNSHSKNIVFCFNRKKAEVSASGEFRVIRGNEYYEEEILGKKFQIPFDSFFQPNPKGFLPILKFIKERIEGENELLVDLFCGSGFFSRMFGENFKYISGYDFVESAVKEAERILISGFPDKKIQFVKTNLFGGDLHFSQEIQNFDRSVLILDPPRSGTGEKLSQIIKNSTFQKIFYVSCNPMTQMMDLEKITETYQIMGFLITDPYPQTPHIESVAFLTKK